MNGQKLGCILLTFMVAFLFGTFLGVLPLASTYTFIDIERKSAGPVGTWFYLAEYLRAFGVNFSGAYFFGLVLGLPITLTTAAILSVVGLVKNQLPPFSALAALIFSLVISVILNWSYLTCQCHPNLASYVFLLPPVFLLCHATLVFGTWFVMRPIWLKANAA